jgi:hypothetical protein
MKMAMKPISVVVMETIVEVVIGVGTIIGLQAHLLSPDGVTAIWGMMLGYAFKNGQTYVNSKGQVIGNGGSPTQPAEGIGPN